MCQIAVDMFKGGRLGKNGQNDQIFVFCSKSVFRYGGITSKIFRELAALEPPPKWGGQRGGSLFFFVFNRKRKWKNILYILKEIFQGFQNCFFHSSIKTEEVLFFIHIYIFVLYKKLNPKWKNFHEQKVFLFRFYILCENFSKIGPIIKKISI